MRPPDELRGSAIEKKSTCDFAVEAHNSKIHTGSPRPQLRPILRTQPPRRTEGSTSSGEAERGPRARGLHLAVDASKWA